MEISWRRSKCDLSFGVECEDALGVPKHYYSLRSLSCRSLNSITLE